MVEQQMIALYEIQNSFSLVHAALMWLLAILYPGLLLVRKESRNKFVLLTFTYIVLFAVGMTFEVNQVHLAFSKVISIGNLSWLIAWLGITLSVYLVCLVFSRTVLKEIKTPRWIHLLFIATITIYLAAFYFGIRHTPEFPNHVVPRNPYDAVYMGAIFVFGAVVFGYITQVFYVHFYRNEVSFVARIRWLLSVLIGVAATGFFVVRIALTGYAFLYPETPATVTLYSLSLGLEVAAGLLIPLPFLPSRVLLFLARPFVFLQKLWSLYNLRVVEARLNELCVPVIPMEGSWWTVPGKLDFVLYRAIIRILDGKSTLKNYLEPHNERPGDGDLTAVGSFSSGLQSWDEATYHKAAALSHLLHTVNDNQRFSDLVNAYQKIGFRLQFGPGQT